MSADAQITSVTPASPPDEIVLSDINDIWTELFVTRVCHETRTPLNAILGFSGLMISGGTGDLTEQQKEFTQHIEEAGEKLLSMINDLTDLARYRLGTLDLELESVDLSAMLERLETQYRQRAEVEHQVFVVDCNPGLAVHADCDRLCRVLRHLLSNAIQYNTYKGYLSLSAAEHGDKIRIVVSDDGNGFSEEEAGAIFEFYRGAVDQARSGSGLGLPTSYFLINAMGGTLNLETVPGDGSIFTIELDKAGADF